MLNLIKIILLVLPAYISAVHDNLNLILDPKTRECFFEDIEKGGFARLIEVFVEAGGNLDIQLEIFGPIATIQQLKSGEFGKPLISERINPARETQTETLTYSQTFSPTVAGTYAICLDNTAARFIPKNVQIDIRPAPRPEPIAVKSGKRDMNENEEMERIKESISRIQKGLINVQLQQQRDRHRLGLHSKTNEGSHNHVIISSIVETAVYIAASLFQLFFVRRWFASRMRAQAGGKQWA
jgi:hypothetical protein